MTTLLLCPAFLGNIRGWQMILLIVLALVLFGGASRIPQIMRNLGKGVHSFKQGLEDAKEEMNKPVKRYGHHEDDQSGGDARSEGKAASDDR